MYALLDPSFLPCIQLFIEPSIYQPFHQYQEMCEVPMDCEDKKSSRNISTSLVEDVKPELIQHANNNNNEDENDYPIAKRLKLQ